MSDSWKFVFVRLYKDANFCWFRSDKDMELKGCVNLRVSVIRTWLMVRTSDSQSREPGFESSCCHFETWAILFTLRWFSSINCLNEYLAIHSSGCVSK